MQTVSGLDYRQLVLDELILRLAEIQQDVAKYVENPERSDGVLSLCNRVRQITRTLAMIELRGAALLSLELDKLLKAFTDQRVTSHNDATLALVHASEQLPEYLDYIRHGSADVPLALLPLLNNMRAVRGKRLLSEAVMLLPNFSGKRKLTPGSLEKKVETQFRNVLKKVRTPLMQALLKWYRSIDVELSLNEISALLDVLKKSSSGTDLSRLWQVARAVVDSLIDGGLEQNAAVKSLCGQLERFLQQLIKLKSKAIYQQTPNELFKNFLYYVALSSSQNKTVVRLRQAYHLDEFLPSESLRDQVLCVLEGPGPKMLDAVGEGIKEELTTIKTAVEIVAHSKSPDPSQLRDLPLALRKLSGTLELLGMHKVTPATHHLLANIESYIEQPDSDRDALLGIASETLNIELALDEYLLAKEQLVRRDLSDPQNNSDDIESANPQFEELVASLLGETLRALDRVKDMYQKALADVQPETQLKSMCHSLSESANALQILPMPEVALLLQNLADYTETLNEQQFANLPSQVHGSYADVVSNLEVYLELHIQRQSALSDLLTRSADALDLLMQAAESESTIEATVETPAMVRHETQAEQIVGDIAAPEMLSVFVEEAMQQFHVISDGMMLLRANPEDYDAMERVRRAYHTLKGSGRMVGASVISEFAWANENLLGRVVSGSVDLNGEVFDLLDESVAAIPQLVDQLHGASEQVEGIDELKARAFLLAEERQSSESIDKQSPTLADLEEKERETRQTDVSEQENTIAEDSDLDSLAETEKQTARLDSDDEPLMDLTQTLDVTGAIDSSETLQLPPMDQADTIEMPGQDSATHDGIDRPVVKRLVEQDLDTGAQTRIDPPGFDPVLFEIFNTECTQHISTLKEIIDRALSGEGKLQASEKMVRALHTLTGSAQTARVDAVAALLSPVEIAVKRKQRAGGRFSRGETLYLNEVISAVEARLNSFRQGIQEPEFVVEVESRLESFTERVLAETDDITRAPRLGELQSVFLEEAQDIIEHLQKALERWKLSPRDRGLIPDFQSSLHTLKGSARVASYAGIADLAHAMEDAVQRWSDTSAPVDSEAFDALEDAISAIGINLEQAQSGESPGYFDWLISELRSVRTDIRLEAENDDVPLLRSSETLEVKQQDTETSIMTIDEPAGDRIRLDSSVVERLTDLSNEVSVHHGQLGQLQGRLMESLGELDQTVGRLRQQLRELDIESDIQMDSGKTALSHELDSLEMDKYGRLQEISRGVLESFSDLDDIRYSLGVNLRHAEVELNEETRINNTIQETLGQIRMVRFSSVVSRLQQTVLSAGVSCGKNVKLSVEGVDSVIDRGVLKHLTSPLEHLLRNAIAHGIEDIDKRKAQGKPLSAQLHVQMLIDDGDIVLTIRDDGAGIDIKKVRKKALDEGIIVKNARLTGSKLLDLLMVPGFSTTSEVDQISGRGVGLDAVRRELLKVGGVLSMQTEAKVGTTFTIRIPQAQFVSQVLQLTVHEGVFAIPANRVHGVNRISRAESERVSRDPTVRVEFNGQACRCVRLSDVLGLPVDPGTRNVSLVYVAVAGEAVAFQVNAVPGYLEAIVKPAGAQLSALGGFAGACVQSNGTVVPLLDLNTLLTRYLERMAESEVVDDTSASIRPDQRLKVLVVDDSITMRKYAERALLRENYMPTLARDGVEAMSLMQQDKPDLVLTDLEMPHMDGFEMVSMIRSDTNLKDLPVIVISSRSGIKHRQRLEKHGIQGFLGKPYQESELLKLLKIVRNS